MRRKKRVLQKKWRRPRKAVNLAVTVVKVRVVMGIVREPKSMRPGPKS